MVHCYDENIDSDTIDTDKTLTLCRLYFTGMISLAQPLKRHLMVNSVSCYLLGQKLMQFHNWALT